MLKSYKYRLRPSDLQKEQIEQHFGCCRLVWNLALAVKIESWRSAKVNISRFDLQKQLVDLKAQYSWLYDTNAQSLQSILVHLDRAYRSFFKGRGFPKFKKKSSRQSFQCPQGVRIENNLIQLPKIGQVPIIISRSFEGIIKTVTISREPSGKYFASVLVDNKISLPSKKAIMPHTMIGIDMGLKSFAVLSNGTQIANPHYFRESLKRLKCLQRRVNRKMKSSGKRKKAQRCVTMQHERIANQRKDFLHKLSSVITKQYDSVCVEDLAIGNMIQNRNLSQAISDAGWGEFIRQLKYKCKWYGKNYFEVPRFFASSKTCSNCGAINETLTLANREWECASCGMVHDRDTNAATNIKQYFLNHSGEGISGEPVELLPKGRAKKREISN